MRYTNPPSTARRCTRASTALLLAAIGIALAKLGCIEAEPEPLSPPTVEVLEVVATDAPIDTEIIGQLDSPQNVEVRARVEAFVDKMPFTEGKEVKEGDLLFELDKKPLQERLAAANASLAEARAALNKYEKDVARLEPLAAKRAVPQQDLDNARASVDVGKAAVLSAQARVESAQLDLGYCEVRAPVSGLIGAKEVSIGELVGRTTPTLLATISTLDPIWHYCRVSEVDYLKAEIAARKTGRKMAELSVSLILADGSVHPAKGKLVFIDRVVDVTTGTLRLRTEFPNPEKLLRPGMFARIKVDLGTRPNTILVPERAVVELQGKHFVWVVSAENKTTQRSVVVGGQIGEKLIIEDGLEPGERIVVEGLQKVREGAAVQPATAEQKVEAGSAQPPAAKAAKE